MKRLTRELEIEFGAHMNRPMESSEMKRSMDEEDETELAEEDQLDEETPWEVAFQAGEEMANKQMIEEEWDDDEEEFV